MSSNVSLISDQKQLPHHVAIIMDGNGRWALQRGLSRVAGHRAGVHGVREIVKACIQRSIPALTLFAFSSENWKRPVLEVTYLLELIFNTLGNEIDDLHKNNVRIQFIGDASSFKPKLRNRIRQAELKTASNTQLYLNIAVNYGGRWDIVNGIKNLVKDVQEGKLDPSEIDQELVGEHLALKGLPEVDLFIRTSGEQRLSNFLLWQLAYSELYFTDCLWPDFTVDEFNQALASYTSRQRRFGHTGEQVEAQDIA